uniref:Uncharacterized protein n=1 Tax=Anguilla anguilla TaxID=7936 RepID=A0A0E9VTH8_ANGAN
MSKTPFSPKICLD